MQDVLYVISLLFGVFILIEGVRLIYYGYRAHLSGERTTPVSQMCKNPRKRILIVGDSTSYGTGASSPNNSLVGRFASDFPDFEIINESENALNIANLEKKLENGSGTFDVLMIHIGGIDTLAFTSFLKMEKLFLRINEHIKRRNFRTVILVTVNNVGLSPFIRFPLKHLFEERSRKMHSFFEKMAQRYNMVHVSLYELAENDPLAKDPRRLFSADKIHPSDEGYGIWYARIKEVITPYLR